MRKHFPGYFQPTKPEFDELWKTGLIVPDANILLHLLRYGGNTRQEVLRTLSAFKPRIWIPHRAAFEFLRRWRTVDADNRAAYAVLQGKLRDGGNHLAAIFNPFVRHQIIDADAEKGKIDRFITNLSKALEKASKTHPSVEEAEAIVDEIAELIGDSIGPEPTNDQKAGWTKEGEKRYANKTPPGYMDEKSKDGEDKFGDFFIWEEIIAEAKSRAIDVIFISDDRKEDWALRQDGNDLGPRPELVQEFAQRTQRRFFSYPLRRFLDRAKSYAKVTLSDQAIAEIEEEEQQARREEQAEAAQRTLELILSNTSPTAGTAIESVTLDSLANAKSRLGDLQSLLDSSVGNELRDRLDDIKANYQLLDSQHDLRKRLEEYSSAYKFVDPLHEYRKQWEAIASMTKFADPLHEYRKQLETIASVTKFVDPLHEYRKQWEAIAAMTKFADPLANLRKQIEGLASRSAGAVQNEPPTQSDQRTAEENNDKDPPSDQDNDRSPIPKSPSDKDTWVGRARAEQCKGCMTWRDSDEHCTRTGRGPDGYRFGRKG